MSGSSAWESACRSDLLNPLTDGARDGACPVFFFGRRYNCLRFFCFLSLLAKRFDLLRGSLAKAHVRIDQKVGATALTICVMTAQKPPAYNYAEFGPWGHW